MLPSCRSTRSFNSAADRQQPLGIEQAARPPAAGARSRRRSTSIRRRGRARRAASRSPPCTTARARALPNGVSTQTRQSPSSSWQRSIRMSRSLGTRCVARRLLLEIAQQVFGGVARPGCAPPPAARTPPAAAAPAARASSRRSAARTPRAALPCRHARTASCPARPAPAKPSRGHA